jgi:hypothetical protein
MVHKMEVMLDFGEQPSASSAGPCSMPIVRLYTNAYKEMSGMIRSSNYRNKWIY